MTGFVEELRGSTGGKAFPQCVFDHWALMPGDPLDQSSMAGAVVREVRERKGLPPVNPVWDRPLERL